MIWVLKILTRCGYGNKNGIITCGYLFDSIAMASNEKEL